MRQGRASRDVSGQSGGWKQEPIVKKINPKAVSQIGQSMGNHSTEKGDMLPYQSVSEVLYQGRGFETPRDRSVEVFKGGSQGRRG